MVSDIADPGALYPLDLINAGGMLYFSADDYFHGRELWKSDGTPEGTGLVSDFIAGTGDGWPVPLGVANGFSEFMEPLNAMEKRSRSLTSPPPSPATSTPTATSMAATSSPGSGIRAWAHLLIGKRITGVRGQGAGDRSGKVTAASRESRARK